VLARGTGGLSGPALRPIALAAVAACFRATGLPIAGMGGVQSGRDALDLLAAGARDVAIGTVLFADPDAPSRIRSELVAELVAHGFASADNAIGAAHDPARPTLDRVSRVGPRKDLHFRANMSG
jgi:dihydroorotate dehydrogenase (NAD+) catalytic subunit